MNTMPMTARAAVALALTRAAGTTISIHELVPPFVLDMVYGSQTEQVDDACDLD